MTRHRWLPKVAVACVMLAGVSACIALALFDRVTVTEVQPEQVGLRGADPLVIFIGVHWAKESICPGQFTVKVTETASQVRVDNVISREHSNSNCAGVGTVNETAWVDVTLAAPLGGREVVRSSDGARLPVANFPD